MALRRIQGRVVVCIVVVGVEGESVQAGVDWRELAPKSAEGYSPTQGRVRNEAASNVKACCGAMA